MTQTIDTLITLLKYPVALLAIVNLMFVGEQLRPLLLASFQGDGIYFWTGAIFYWVIWKIFFSNRYLGSFIPTLIHETIHAVFAMLTLHRVIGFMVHWQKGGHVRYVGGSGNWLITISPYFFPLAFCVMAIVSFFTKIPSPEKELFFGVIWGFEFLCQWKQIHWEQSDLQEEGFGFVVLFLPTAMLLSHCLIFGLMLQGIDFLPELLSDCVEYNQRLCFFLMERIGK